MSTTASVKASPTARRAAEALGVDLATVAGTGPGGRIVKDDVERAARSAAAPGPSAASAAPAAPAAPAASAPAPGRAGPVAAGGRMSASGGHPSVLAPPARSASAGSAAAPSPAGGAIPAGPPAAGGGGPIIQRLTSIQKVVVRRMVESRTTVPEFELRVTVDMEAAVALRARLKAAAREGDCAPSFNDMVVRASALALRAHPRANGSYREDGFVLHERVNVGVAVAAPDALVVPVVDDADVKSLGAIARETRALAAAARDGRLTPDQLDGGTFTVSNLGMFGIQSFSAVINVPQAAILAVGALERRAVVVGDELVARHVMDVALCCDHRILYGADAAAFLADLRDNLVVPERLL